MSRDFGTIKAIADEQIQTVCQAIDKVCDYLPTASIKQEPSTPPHDDSRHQASPFNKAFCAIRPPGHHCGEDLPSGYVLGCTSRGHSLMLDSVM